MRFVCLVVFLAVACLFDCCVCAACLFLGVFVCLCVCLRVCVFVGLLVCLRVVCCMEFVRLRVCVFVC